MPVTRRREDRTCRPDPRSAGDEAQIIETYSEERRLGERGEDYQGRKRRDSSVDILNKSDRSLSRGSSRSRW